MLLRHMSSYPIIPVLCTSLVASQICPFYDIIQPVLCWSTTLYSDTICFTFQHQQSVNHTTSSEHMSCICQFLALQYFCKTVVFSCHHSKHFCILYLILPADPQHSAITPLFESHDNFLQTFIQSRCFTCILEYRKYRTMHSL